MADILVINTNIIKKYFLVACALFVLMLSALSPVVYAGDTSGCKTGGSSFFGVPTWYQYLEFERTNDRCSIINEGTEAVLLVMFGVLDILFYLSGFIAAGYIIWGGLKFILAQGAPDKISSARSTILNAVIGLIIVIVASTAISFLAKKVGGL